MVPKNNKRIRNNDKMHVVGEIKNAFLLAGDGKLKILPQAIIYQCDN